jgi:glutathione S-transferase
MLNQDFKDILSCLRNESVEFIVVGAFALAVHGHPRATGDIDIWVNSTAENSRRVLRALSAFGAPMSDLAADDFTIADVVFQIGVEPLRIDILTSIDGLDFAEAWKNKLSVVVDGIGIEVLSKGDLLRNKIAAGRDKDLGDVAWLRKH